LNIQNSVFCVLDVETTGLDHEADDVVEVACVPCSLAIGVMLDEATHTLVQPGIPIPASGSAIHHITDADVLGKPSLPDAMREKIKVTTERGQTVACAAHNAEFGSSFLPPLGFPMICTKRLAQKLWPELDCYSNQFLRYHLKLDIPSEIKAMPMHRALPDAAVTAFLLLHELREVISRAKEPDSITADGLLKWISEPNLLKTCRFGKHKGGSLVRSRISTGCCRREE
jgi:exodeoxyribonuclease X